LVLNVWKGVTRAADTPVTIEPSSVLLPATDGWYSHADHDILFCLKPTDCHMGVLGIVYITHPFTGKGRKLTWGQYQPWALTDSHADKTSKYYTNHSWKGYL
jgi:hypothetical protein